MMRTICLMGSGQEEPRLPPSTGIFRIAELKKSIPIAQGDLVLESGFRPLFAPLIQCQNGSGESDKIDNSCKITHL